MYCCSCTVGSHQCLHRLHVDHSALVTAEYLGPWGELVGQPITVDVGHVWISAHVVDDWIERNVVRWPVA